jgi:hypothetical protein
MDAVSLSRSVRLVATSKTLPQMGQTLGHLFDMAAKLTVHCVPFGIVANLGWESFPASAMSST